MKVRCAFNIWRRKTDESVVEKMKVGKALAHFHGTLLSKAFKKWITYTRMSLTKQVWWVFRVFLISPLVIIVLIAIISFYFSFQLLNRQCMWFHNTRLTAKFFYQWKISLNQQRESMNKSYVALWHWSLTLQRKVK